MLDSFWLLLLLLFLLIARIYLWLPVFFMFMFMILFYFCFFLLTLGSHNLFRFFLFFLLTWIALPCQVMLVLVLDSRKERRNREMDDDEHESKKKTVHWLSFLLNNSIKIIQEKLISQKASLAIQHWGQQRRKNCYCWECVCVWVCVSVRGSGNPITIPNWIHDIKKDHSDNITEHVNNVTELMYQDPQQHSNIQYNNKYSNPFH